MGKKIFRLTESELKGMIKESVKNILREWGSDEYEGRLTDMLDDRAYQEDLWAEREREMEEYWNDKYKRLREKYPGKSDEWYDAFVDIFESKDSNKNKLNEWNGSDELEWEEKRASESLDDDETASQMEEAESFQNNQGYSHFAVSKKSGKIVNGWDYSEYDPSELRQFKKDYFDTDMIDYGFNPKDFRILTYKYLVRNGIDPNDNNNWANNDETNNELVG